MPIPEQLLRELLPEIEHEHFEFDDEEEEAPHSEKEFEVDEIDLNQDKRMELEVRLVDRYWCSPTGNCVIWVYRKVGDRYERILKVDGIQHLELEDSKTKGYRDITAAQHSSAVEAELFLYKFDGKEYRLVACSHRRFPWDRESKDPPEITPIACVSQID